MEKCKYRKSGGQKGDQDLEEFVSENKDTFEIIAIKRNIDNEVQEKALKVVREFIADRNLILYGGIAIDYALRLKGSQIYNEDTLPDYDVFSPNSVDDAYDLAEILHKLKFKNVDAIRAFHVQTQRVRVDSIIVADISYCPRPVYNKLKYLQYQNVRILDPIYQRLDIHHALSFPLDNIPYSPSFQHRWKKDIKRLQLFEEHYSLEVNDATISSTKKEFAIPKLDYALCGVAAYGILWGQMNSIDSKAAESVPKISAKIVNGKITVDPCPENELVVCASNLPEKEGKQYNSYMDWLPKHIVTSDLKILSMKDKMLSISIVNEQKICSLQYLMKYFLVMYNITNSDYYKVLYVGCMNMVKWADQFYKDAKKEDIEFNPFLLPFKFLGDDSVSEAQHIVKVGLLVKVGLASDSEKQLFQFLGKNNWYISQGSDRPKPFDYDNPLFKMDGSIINT